MTDGLFLSRLALRRDASTAALSRLLDPTDEARAADANHRLIWSLFADDPDRERDFLWRREEKGRFLVLSRREPDDAHRLFSVETKPFRPCLAAGDRLSFMLRVNATRDRPTAKLEKDAKTGALRNRRVDLVMDRLYNVRPQRKGDPGERALRRDEIAREVGREWLTRQGEKRGFGLDGLSQVGYQVLRLPHRPAGKGRELTFGVLDLAGALTVTEPDRFLDAVASGFGRARAFGMGLMLIRRT